jgi:Acetyltransferase (GNAT) family
MNRIKKALLTIITVVGIVPLQIQQLHGSAFARARNRVSNWWHTPGYFAQAKEVTEKEWAEFNKDRQAYLWKHKGKIAAGAVGAGVVLYAGYRNRKRIRQHLDNALNFPKPKYEKLIDVPERVGLEHISQSANTEKIPTPPHNPTQNNDSVDTFFEQKLQTKHTFYKVEIKNNNEVAGEIIYSLDGDRGHIDLLLVHPKFRSKKYGTKLMDYASSALREKGARSLSLHITEDNPIGKKFYKSTGFTSKGTHGFEKDL